ncbi:MULTISPECIES: hypothetical protein [Aeromonas]|uniref:hypothetical protein n=1 Tax=Aeromonas TaxID=642 RepID=UPI001C233404|nr:MULTISPECIES: hypothetical protein [Aeromonas]QXC00210.1 hypothetical protein I6L48_04640 [Aeromonas sp. FDAARGOS 1418]
MNELINKISSMTFDMILVQLILLLLFLSSLREILKSFGVFKKLPYISSWIYGDAPDKQIKEAVKETLTAVGLGSTHTMNRLNIINPAVRHSILRPSSDIEKLIIFISKHIYKHEHPLVYGSKTPTKSSYYINTMDASLDDVQCKEMVRILYGLYTEIYKKTKPFDFIVVPKLGNPTFVKELCKEIGDCQLLIVKPDADRSRLRGKNPNMMNNANIEGLNLLIERAKVSDRELNGAIIDCNCSGGSSLINAAEILNTTIEKNSLQYISPISHVLTIFRADTDLSPKEIDEKFNRKGLQLFRVIDLDEDIKSDIMALKTECENDSNYFHQVKVRRAINAIVDSARSRGLLINNS